MGVFDQTRNNQTQYNTDTVFHFKRDRLNQLFTEAMKYPLVMVCAGGGYGKTSAVHDFTQEYQASTIWVQLSERDNIGARFWENFIHSVTQINEPFAKTLNKSGFPDTLEKLNQSLSLFRDHVEIKRRIIVLDDFHFIDDPSVIRFVEEGFRCVPPGTSLFLISRSTPRINIAGLVSKDHIFNISEEDLRFNDDELAQYFRRQNISLKPDSLRGIMQDTEGWAFAINLIARSYKKAPGYEGYLRNAMKSNIFRYMETETWDGISERLRHFLVRLSLIDHLSVDLISLLAGEDESLINELEKQNAYIRRDSYIDAYLIHPLFLEFLASKQELLTEEQKNETYEIAGAWCDKNGFKIDALSYYEKIADYEEIVRMFVELPAQIPYDIARYATGVFERAPAEAFDTVFYLAAMYLRALMSQGLWRKTIELAEYFEERYIKLPNDNVFRRRTLRSIYYCCAFSRASMGLTEDKYDFDLYYEKLEKCLSEPAVNMAKLLNPCHGPWVCKVGSARKGAPEEFIAALKRSAVHISRCFNNLETGEDDLASGELNFYRNNISGAESFTARVIDSSRGKKQFENEHRALFYTLRIAVMQGNYEKVERALKELGAQLYETGYSNRFINYDIVLCWYYCALGMPEKTPDWLKDAFSLYAHAGFVENFANQMKARYCYATRDFPALLSYIHDMKKRESYLFGRVEMLAIEACVYYKMKNKEKACASLEEAYKTASPNNILTPFIELGKDMRTLTAFAMKKNLSIPKQWLEDINRRSAYYAKRLAHIMTEYKQANGIGGGISISRRENEILLDLSHGLSRTEIAVNRSLSINTVKMVINRVYMKLGAENLADAIRIAAERKIV
ncbi:MAG: LuxR C-terminal-related transcriptional regulator [Treponema sp.]|jgi:LuxR family maltose regulon positive regulatory protein|nr:LuxR C-terminal-related transcriptional regulator [Treponema sp.]